MSGNSIAALAKFRSRGSERRIFAVVKEHKMTERQEYPDIFALSRPSFDRGL
jgi:hypothetical protein